MAAVQVINFDLEEVSAMDLSAAGRLNQGYLFSFEFHLELISFCDEIRALGDCDFFGFLLSVENFLMLFDLLPIMT